VLLFHYAGASALPLLWAISTNRKPNRIEGKPESSRAESRDRVFPTATRRAERRIYAAVPEMPKKFHVQPLPARLPHKCGVSLATPVESEFGCASGCRIRNVNL
jgi:hypothetical protein